jgi:hypothetical protein
MDDVDMPCFSLTPERNGRWQPFFYLAFCKDYFHAHVNQQHKNTKNMFIQKSTFIKKNGSGTLIRQTKKTQHTESI